MMATPATPPTTPPAMAPTFVPDDGGDLTEGVGSAVCVLSDADVDIEDPGVEVEGIEDVGVTIQGQISAITDLEGITAEEHIISTPSSIAVHHVLRSFYHFDVGKLSQQDLFSFCSPTQQIISDHVWKRKRPETDYERWQREQDESHEPGGRPQYGPPNEFRKDDYVADGTEELLHGQHYSVEHRAPSHGYFVSSTAPAKPITSEGSFIPTARKALHLGDETFMGSLLFFAVLLMISFVVSKSIKRGCRSLPLPRSDTLDRPGLDDKQLFYKT
ncbi:hypothetical protein LV164_005195 [Aspergillus fumigatus]|nr:hypothetical protein LV164_005195 [Aspergillus fumigatus]